MDEQEQHNEPVTQRIGWCLQKAKSIQESTGKVTQSIATPFLVELKPRNMLRIILGAYILCVSGAFTEEFALNTIIY